MKKSVILLSIILALFSHLPVSAAESKTVDIEGLVKNSTVDGSSVAGLEVILTKYVGTDEVETVTTTTDNEGLFVFKGLSTESGYIFQAMVDFQGAEYYSQALSLDGETTVQNVDITVYDSTTNVENITVTTSHTIIYPKQNSITVNEYFMFANNSDRTYIGAGNTSGNDDAETLEFPLLEGATGLTYDMGLMDCCVVATEDGFSDTMPVTPGMHEFVYSYEVPVNTSGYDLSRSVNYLTDYYALLIEYSGEIEIVGNSLVIQEPLHIEGSHFSYITGHNLLKGDILQVKFPEIGITTNDGNVILLALILILIVSIGLGITYFIIKRRNRPIADEERDERRRQVLLTEMARLDDDFGEGSIDEETYRVMRASTKERLVELMRRPVAKE